jgi:cytochrome c biogenesis protein CcmG, thiol:disulfide interchange protein DsbE
MGRFIVPAAVAVVFVVLVGFLYVGLYLNPTIIPSPYIGKPAPALQVPTLQDADRVLSSTDFAGRPWVLNVWGTWCVACREEHQTLLAIARTKAAPIYGLDWKDDRSSALEWLRRLGNPYDAVGFDDEGRVAIDWGVYGAPETFLVDATGTVVYKHIGPMTLQTWREHFLPVIEAAAGPGS